MIFKENFEKSIQQLTVDSALLYKLVIILLLMDTADKISICGQKKIKSQ